MLEHTPSAPVLAKHVRILREALEQAHRVLESAKGNINPERGYCDAMEAEVAAAVAAAESALAATKGA